MTAEFGQTWTVLGKQFPLRLDVKSLELLINRWKMEDIGSLPPYGESIVRSTFSEAGIEASKDLIRLYGTIGGMDIPDAKLWRLWPLFEVTERKSEASNFGVLFSDYLLDSWAYRIKPNNVDTSAVYVDYFDGKDPSLVACTLEEFFEKYVQNADSLLNQPS